MSSAPQNMSPQALYRACMKEAAAQGRTLMQRLVARAGDSLPRRAAASPDERERKLLTESWRTLVKHDGALCEAYPQALLSEFAQAIGGVARKSGALSFDSLELMGEDQMQESVELLRTQQAVLSQVEAELTELTALICAVQGLPTVQSERNPLRPEVYVRSLRTVTLQSPVPPAVRKRWMQHMGEALGPELAQVYRNLCTMLRSQGVAEARFNAAPMAQADAPRTQAAEPPAAAQAASLLNLNELRRLLAGEFDHTGPPDAAAAAERPAEFSATVPAAFEVLQEMKQVDKVMARLKQRQASDAARTREAGSSAQQTAGPKPTPGQALGMEVVTLMVENIASDPRLLPPVQQTVRDLEPALLRLALGDPRFFSDRKHPARRLLDQMTQRSLAWEAADAPGFAEFLEPLQQAVEALLATRSDGPEPFEFALHTLEEAWGDQQHRDRRYREKAVRALLQAEQRNLLAAKLASEMRRRPDVAAAPREIAAFVSGPWCQVMAHARLTDQTGATDPGGYFALISDLVWSAQPQLAGANAARLGALAPELVAKLRHGLATIDYPAASTKRFLDWLAGAFRQAAQTAGRVAQPAAPAAPQEFEAVGAGEDDEHDSWLAPIEAQQSGFVDTDLAAQPKPLFQPTQPGFGDTRPPAEEAGPGLAEAGLQPGAWVEMMMEGGWGRYQVTWASPHGTLFMFAGARGKPHSMTGRFLSKMLKGGTLRMISGQPVVEGALDAVAQAALRNSVDLRL
jgi:hypothetical protein